jgi:hypothetical protein
MQECVWFDARFNPSADAIPCWNTLYIENVMLRMFVRFRAREFQANSFQSVVDPYPRDENMFVNLLFHNYGGMVIQQPCIQQYQCLIFRKSLCSADIQLDG